MLLPNGKRCGSEWRVGSVRGEKGASLKVCTAGHKAGAWGDFAENIGGGLIGLWAAVKGQTLKGAFEEARAYLGIAKPTLATPSAHRAHARPAKPSIEHPHYRECA